MAYSDPQKNLWECNVCMKDFRDPEEFSKHLEASVKTSTKCKDKILGYVCKETKY